MPYVLYRKSCCAHLGSRTPIHDYNRTMPHALYIYVHVQMMPVDAALTNVYRKGKRSRPEKKPSTQWIYLSRVLREPIRAYVLCTCCTKSCPYVMSISSKHQGWSMLCLHLIRAIDAYKRVRPNISTLPLCHTTIFAAICAQDIVWQLPYMLRTRAVLYAVAEAISQSLPPP
jgi:hypothetical protein